MSRPIKVPEELYKELQREAEQDGISVMEALQCRFRRKEEELTSLRQARSGTAEELRRAQVALSQAMTSDLAGKAAARRLQEEMEDLRRSIAEQEEEAKVLEGELSAERRERASVDSDLSRSKKLAQRRQAQLYGVAAVAGTLFVAWVAWRWWKQYKARPAVVETETKPVEMVWPIGV